MIFRCLARELIMLCCWAAVAYSQTLSEPEFRGLREDRSLLRGVPTVVIFLSARCPLSNTYGERFQRIYDEYRPRGVKFYFINSNVNESDAEVLRNAQEHGFTFPILRDEASRAAENFGALATPEIFLLDSETHVQYHGSFDDSQNPARVHHHFLSDALEQVLAGATVTVSEHKSFGCTIKRPRKL